MANKCFFTGNLCFDIESKQAGQHTVSNNTIAVNDYYKGEKKTTFVPVTFWNKQVELLQNFCKKGSKLLVTCKFDIQEWEKDGEKKSKPNFSVIEMEFLDSKKDSGQQQSYQQPQEPMHNTPPNSQKQDDFEDNIPF